MGYPVPGRLRLIPKRTRQAAAAHQSLAALRYELLAPCPLLHAALGGADAARLCDALVEEALDDGHPMNWTLHLELLAGAERHSRGVELSPSVWREALIATGRRWLKWGHHTRPWIALISSRVPETVVLARRPPTIADDPSLSVAPAQDLLADFSLLYQLGLAPEVALDGAWQRPEHRPGRPR